MYRKLELAFILVLPWNFQQGVGSCHYQLLNFTIIRILNYYVIIHLQTRGNSILFQGVLKSSNTTKTLTYNEVLNTIDKACAIPCVGLKILIKYL